MPEKRHAKRRRLGDFVDAYDRQNGRLMGQVVDITDSGMRLLAPGAVTSKTGGVLKLRLALPFHVAECRCADVDVLPVWSREKDDPLFEDFYDSGLKFFAASPLDISILDKLMDYSAMDDWSPSAAN